MAEIKLTAAQQTAVDNSGGAILVSAAAGSGKTKVLVDRLMRMVCDPVDPKNINEFLIITYTKAAASELRGKISAELGNRLAMDPSNKHLQRQLSLVYLTEISTVHAFCSNLLRAYAHLLDLPADFRVAEEAECSELRRRCLEQVIEQAYQEWQDDRSFGSVVDILGYGRDDNGILTVVASMFQAAQCHVSPDDWIRQCEQTLEISQYSDCCETPWGKYLVVEFRRFVKTQISLLMQAISEMTGITPLEKAYMPAFKELVAQLECLQELNGWGMLCEEIPVVFPRLSGVRNFEDKELLERLKGIRSRCIDGLRDWKSVFYASDQEAMEDLAASAAALKGALELVRRFSRAFAAEKKKRRILDFGDLEHFAIRLLIDRSTYKPTAAACEVSERYAEIMVDEYQDSNAVQEAIFGAISHEGKNRFMVGDVKQSIYRFRLADPTIFLEKYKNYADYPDALPGEPRRILLSENFRSRPEILEAVNHVFGTVMSEQVGDLTYGEDETLKVGLSFSQTSDPVVELHCMEPERGEDEALSPDKGKTEAEFVANRIAELLADGRLHTVDGDRAIHPEDIVILLRSVNSAAPDYMAALRRRGIPCSCDRGESLLDTQEVEVLLSILEIIDNPRRDIPLVSALSSPVYRFDANDLARIRAQSGSGDFYEALTRDSDKKSQHFLRRLEEIREQAKWLPLHALIRTVYEQTRIEAIYGAMENGDRRKKNLQAFFTFAISYAADGSATLMDFLSEITRRREQGIALQGAVEQGGAVQIMSIHKSKGLEFPVVFLADLSRRFNAEDLRQQVVTHPELYVASNMIEWETQVRYPTLAKKAITMKMRQESLSEELRVLYVAMTRAKHRLIMTYCSAYLQSELKTIAAESAYPVSPDFAGRAKNPGFWVLMGAFCRTEAGELFAIGGYPQNTIVSSAPWKICLHSCTSTLPKPFDEKLKEDGNASVLPVSVEYIAERLSFRYKHKKTSSVPTKITATQLKGRALDKEVMEEAAQLIGQKKSELRKPNFVLSARKATVVERGIANHLFLQFADYPKCVSLQGIAEELRRMQYQELLTVDQADMVEKEQILELFTSQFGNMILCAEQVAREMKFSILVDAGAYYEDVKDEQVLLQGVVDCLLVEEDGLTIIDFKTDAIRCGQEPDRAASYLGQINAYSEAMSRIYKRAVKRRYLYFLSTGCAFEV